jgi:hypothetical protein
MKIVWIFDLLHKVIKLWNRETYVLYKHTVTSIFSLCPLIKRSMGNPMLVEPGQQQE